LVVLCVCDTGPDRLDGSAELEGADGGGGEEGSEGEVWARRDDNGLVFLLIELAREVEAGPAEVGVSIYCMI
jgi:hypothetical protein